MSWEAPPKYPPKRVPAIPARTLLRTNAEITIRVTLIPASAAAVLFWPTACKRFPNLLHSPEISDGPQ